VSTESSVRATVDRAAARVAPAWPLHSFVTANPLSGLEDRPFHEAVAAAERLFGGRGYPSPEVFRRAWAGGEIDADLLAARLDALGADTDPAASLDALAAEWADHAPSASSPASSPTAAAVDRVLTKWLAAFCDQGRTEWQMPDREAGFYAAVRAVARYDREIPGGRLPPDALPADPEAALEAALSTVPESRWEAVLAGHLAALPGWTGLLAVRGDAADEWAAAAPADLLDYLAIRLTLVAHAGLAVDDVATVEDASPTTPPLADAWLRAWEATYRDALVAAVADEARARSPPAPADRPDAQLTFCIDTRSEVFRRHLEATGDYETHGYAGFFGVPMRYRGYGAPLDVDACPPILDAAHHVTDAPTPDHGSARARHDRQTGLVGAARDAVAAVTGNLATPFAYVEQTGVGYGVALAARTLAPGLTDRLAARLRPSEDPADFCRPTLDGPAAADGGTEVGEVDGTAGIAGEADEAGGGADEAGGDVGHDHDLTAGIPHEARVGYAAGAVETMGWQRFARLVVFAGHAGHSANNPFDSSLDCGACAGNPGGPSARVLAAVCNDPDVRVSLRERGIAIPDDTVFVAAEHDTTRDVVRLFDGDVPASHEADLARLRGDLETARRATTAERVRAMGGAGDGVRETSRRAVDWAETRPEWGLAGNAAFVVGPRRLTAGLDLGGRTFLHSYEPATDPEGDALETILAGPMVVTQWINTHYYFATVDSGAYGSGSKVTQSPVGNVGVVQGNGGDLLTGLPLQSVAAADGVPHHRPLRLSVLVYAPVERVDAVLDRHAEVARLLDNDWLSLTVVEPTQDATPFRYRAGGRWVPTDDAAAQESASPASSPATDDEGVVCLRPDERTTEDAPRAADD
jgi:hypothetical protein